MPEQWGYSDDSSKLGFQPNGMSNKYDLDKQDASGPEYITIYDPSGSFKSRLISAVLILAVVGFCGLLFSYLVKEKGGDHNSATSAIAEVHAN
jgi:hypothetical protein